MRDVARRPQTRWRAPWRALRAVSRTATCSVPFGMFAGHARLLLVEKKTRGAPRFRLAPPADGLPLRFRRHINELLFSTNTLLLGFSCEWVRALLCRGFGDLATTLCNDCSTHSCNAGGSFGGADDMTGSDLLRRWYMCASSDRDTL